MTTVINQPVAGPSEPHGVAQARGLFDGPILRQALRDAVLKMDPRTQVKNPVMFVVLVGSVITFIEAIAHPSKFTWSITIWLVLTVLFANFAEAMAEAGEKLKRRLCARCAPETEARRLKPDGTEELIAAANLSKGDLVVCEAGDVSLPTERSSKASPRWTSQRLPVNRRRSSESPVATLGRYRWHKGVERPHRRAHHR